MAAATPKHEVGSDDLIACSGCDLLHHKRQLNVGEVAHCTRCGDILQTRKPDTVDRTLALAFAALVFLVVSLVTPFLELSRAGIESNISVLDAVYALWHSNMRWLGITTLALIVLIPLFRLLILVWVLGTLRVNRTVQKSMKSGYRWAVLLEPWAMADIFMVGVLISLVKISSLATLSLGVGFWSLLILLIVSFFISHTLCNDTVWTRLTQRQ